MRLSLLRHVPDLFWKKRPIQLTVFLTRRCNGRCGFCFYPVGEQERGRSSPGSELSLAELERIAASAGRLLWLAFSGGEIFLRPDLAEVVEAFAHHCRPAIILLPSNGLLPERISRQCERILAACPESIVAVKLSLDGPPRLHDRLRGVPGAFSRLMNSYQRLAGLAQRYPQLELGINTVFCAANQARMAETIAMVAGLDHCRTHTVSLIRGEIPEPALAVVDPACYRAACELLEHNLKNGYGRRYGFAGARLKAAQDILQRRRILALLAGERSQPSCCAGRLTLTVTETGEVFPCESFTAAFRIGNLRAQGYDLLGLYRSARAEAVRQRIVATGCVCTHECYQMMNILFRPGSYPALLRQYLALPRSGRGKGEREGKKALLPLQGETGSRAFSRDRT